jgi:hypothetical protein
MNAIRPATPKMLADECTPDTGNTISILHGNGFLNVEPAPQIMLNADQWILID